MHQLDTSRTRLKTSIRSLHGLVSFRIVQHFLRERNFPTSRSWADVADNIVNSCDERDALRATDALLTLYEEYKIWGKKVVALFPMTAQIPEILRKLPPLEETPYSATYPLPLPEHRLRKLPEIPCLVAVRDIGEGLILVFCSPRYKVVREQLSLDHLRETYIEQYKSFDELFAVRKTITQAYDVVYIPRNQSPVQVRVDCLQFRHTRSADKYLDSVLVALASLVNIHTVAFPLKKLINLFPLIRKIYDNPKEGRVCEISFECSTQARHHQHFRQVRADLRNEVYHRAGLEAVGMISPYLLAVAWDKDEQGNPLEAEIVLPGNRKMLRDAKPLTRAFIPKAVSREAFDFAIRRIQSYL
jgi:hypothetical protein